MNNAKYKYRRSLKFALPILIQTANAAAVICCLILLFNT